MAFFVNHFPNSIFKIFSIRMHHYPTKPLYSLVITIFVLKFRFKLPLLKTLDHLKGGFLSHFHTYLSSKQKKLLGGKGIEEAVNVFKNHDLEMPFSQGQKCFADWLKWLQNCIDHRGEYLEPISMIKFFANPDTYICVYMSITSRST